MLIYPDRIAILRSDDWRQKSLHSAQVADSPWWSMEQALAEEKTTSGVKFISRASVMDESFSVFGLWRTEPSWSMEFSWFWIMEN